MNFQKPKRFVNRIFLHCSYSPYKHHDDISVIRKWHVEENGWSDVGYHFFIKFNGTIQKGRDIEITPAAQYPHNSNTIAICLHGKTESDFTEAQLKACRDLCLEINEKYFGGVTFHGHTEVSSKTCPVFDYKDLLKLDKQGYITLPTLEFKKLDAIPFKPKPEKKKLSFWQKLLKVLGVD